MAFALAVDFSDRHTLPLAQRTLICVVRKLAQMLTQRQLLQRGGHYAKHHGPRVVQVGELLICTCRGAA